MYEREKYKCWDQILVNTEKMALWIKKSKRKFSGCGNTEILLFLYTQQKYSPVPLPPDYLNNHPQLLKRPSSFWLLCFSPPSSLPTCCAALFSLLLRVSFLCSLIKWYFLWLPSCSLTSWKISPIFRISAIGTWV